STWSGNSCGKCDQRGPLVSNRSGACAMKRSLSVAIEHYPIAGSFTISRGARTRATVVTCLVREGEAVGRGECVPYARYGESPEGVEQAILSAAEAIAGGLDRQALLE